MWSRDGSQPRALEFGPEPTGSPLSLHGPGPGCTHPPVWASRHGAPIPMSASPCAYLLQDPHRHKGRPGFRACPRSMGSCDNENNRQRVPRPCLDYHAPRASCSRIPLWAIGFKFPVPILAFLPEAEPQGRGGQEPDSKKASQGTTHFRAVVLTLAAC